MQTCFITFLSQTAANRFKKLAQARGVSCKIVQTPKELSAGGCSYGARCRHQDLAYLLDAARENRVPYSRVFLERRDTNGRKYYEKINEF